MNAYEEKAGVGVIAGKLCDPCLSALRVLQKRALYKYTYLYLLPLSDPVSTGMDDRLRTGKPSWYVTSQLGQLSLSSLQGR